MLALALGELRNLDFTSSARLRRLFLMRLVCLVVAALLSTILCAQQESTQRPNLVLLVADDLGWADVGWHNEEMRTPRLDGMVGEGVELDAHYVQPQCTPTRVALMTGRYPSRFGDHCTTASNARSLPFDTPTLASVLREHGYATGLFGKWHLGSKPEWGPNHFGFDRSYGSLAGAIGMYDHRYRLNSPFAQTWHRDHEILEETGHATDLVTNAAIAWMKEQKDRPFFLYVPFHAVHVPLVEEQRWILQNGHIENADRRLFAAAVSHLDHAVGRIIDAIEEQGVTENTLVVFVSDNGGLRSHRGNAYPPPDTKLATVSSNLPLRGWKTDVFEGGIRVPAFVRWPSKLAPGKSDVVLHAVDWLPTVRGLLGLSALPESDGVDIWPQLTGSPKPRQLYWKWAKKLALRDGKWKVVRNGGKGSFQLFDLEADPSEERDLAKSDPAQLARMMDLLKAQVQLDAKPLKW